MKITRTFTRRNGEKMVIEVTIDVEKIAEDMAHNLARSGRTRSTKCDGGVIATVIA